MRKTRRRDALMRKGKQGKLIGRCEMHLTDDYAWDNATGFGKTEWLPVHVVDSYMDRKEGHLNLHVIEFTGKCGSAREDENGIITLYVHSNLWYSLREKEA